MKQARGHSSIITLTLAEFAWLVVFGVLLLLKSRDTEMASLRKERDSASQQATANSNWREKFDKAAEESGRAREDLQNLVNALAGHRPEEIINLLTQAREATNQLAQLKHKHDVLQKLLDSLAPNAAALSNEVNRSRESSEQALVEARREAAVLRKNIADLQQALATRHADEFSIRREITGLPDGPLRRVVILLDTSSSMHGSSAWQDALRLVRVWLTYLPIQECILVTFDDKIRVFPEQGYLELRQPDGVMLFDNNHKRLLAQINSLQLGTFTDTLRAFETAYRFPDVSLILLFTDGKPRTKAMPFEKMAPQIYSLVARHGQIPILAVALGEYEVLEPEDRRAGKNLQIEFLKRLAELSHGAFMAR